METVVPPPADAELHLLTEWGDADAATRRRTPRLEPWQLHVMVIVGLMLLPASAGGTREPTEAPRIVTPLFMPPPN